MTDLKTAIGKLPNDHLKRALTVLLEEAQQDIANFEEAVEIWFNNTMERVSGWYKRRTQVLLLIWAVVVTIGANEGAGDASPDRFSFGGLAGRMQELAEFKSSMRFEHIDGADHWYAGKTAELWSAVERWLGR